MMKKLMNGLVTGLAALTLSGCGIYMKPKDLPQEFSVCPEVRLGVDGFYTKANVSKQLRTTPVHRDDASFLSGSTTTGNPNGLNFALKAGAAASAGVPEFRVYLGGDFRYGGLSGAEARKQQVSDPRDEAHGSFVKTQLLQQYTVLPLVGIETVLGPLTLRVEGGLPYSRLDVESGHDRYNKFERVQHDSWQGRGEYVRGDVLFKISNNLRAGISVGTEHFNAEFGGEKSDVRSILGFLQFEYKLAK